MPAGNSGNTSFDAIARLDGGQPVADRLRKLCRQLRSAGADGAADRFREVGDMFADGLNPTFEEIEQHIAPERAVDELNSARGRPSWYKLFHRDWRGGLRPLLGFPKSARIAHLLRNVAALAPLIFTWITLGLAAKHYDSDIKNNSKAVSQPFLLLWQQGFGTGFLSFEVVTIIDFSLLALVVLLTFWVHWAEGQADRSAALVYEAMDSLKAFAAKRRFYPTSLSAATPEQWAQITSETLTKTIDFHQELSTASERAIKEASDRLQAIQDTSQELVRDFRTAVLETLTSVNEQNEHFIENTRETNQQVLQALVEQQMRPLLSQVQDLVNQFRTQQVAYTGAVTDLTRTVGAVEASAATLAASAQAFDASTHSIAGSLAAMASSQERFAASVEGSSQSMGTAAAAMAEVKDALHADLHGRLQEMTGNITGASASLGQAQAGLASTAKVMSTAANTFAETTDRLAGKLQEPMDLLRQALSEGISIEQPHRRRGFFGRWS